MNKFLANNRIVLSRIVALLLLLVIIFSHPKAYNTIFYEALYFFGSSLVVISILGRVFASLFMSDNRNKNLVNTGVYSITRNPLYFFSFLGTLGIAMVYGSVIMFIVLTVLYLVYYHFVIAFEQQDLQKRIGTAYINYMNSNVPKFFPNFSLWKSNDYITVNYKVVLQTMLDAFWLFFTILILRIILFLQSLNVIPTFFSIL